MELNYSKDSELFLQLINGTNVLNFRLKKEDDNISTLAFVDEYHKLLPIPEYLYMENSVTNYKIGTLENLFVLSQSESYRLKRKNGEILLSINSQRIHNVVGNNNSSVIPLCKRIPLTDTEDLSKLGSTIELGSTIGVFFDGASRGNPGKAGCGAVIHDSGIKHEVKKYLGPNCTNNEAEYNGLILGLEHVIEISKGRKNMLIIFYGDSKLVIEQMSGNWKINAENLKPLNVTAKELVQTLKNNGVSLSFKWIPREENKEADILSNLAIP